MSEAVLALVDAIKAGDAVSTEGAFAAAMAEKLGGKIDGLRQQVAGSMFTAPQGVAEETIEEGSQATAGGLQNRMDKNFTKSVATRYDGTRKQEADGKKGIVKTAKIMKTRGIDAAAAKKSAEAKNNQENEM